MCALTPQERQAILFLMTVALIGVGLEYCIKVYSPIKRFVTVESTFAKLDINQATADDLAGSRSISPALAKKIIAYRNAHGPFADLKEIKVIKGIGEARYKKINETFFVP